MSRFADAMSAILLVLALVLIQVLIGGTRLLFSFPAYAILAAIGFLTLLSLRRVKSVPNWICAAATVLFMGYILARAWCSPGEYLSRSDIYSVLAGLLVYFFVGCFLVEPKRRMAVVACLLVFSIAHIAIGAIQFRDGHNFMLIPFLQRYDYGRRASGFYVCPNHLAGLLEVLAIFGLSFVCWSRWSRWIKLLIGYIVIVCYLGVALTGSRGGYLSSVASLMCFAALSLIVLWQAPRRLFWSFAIASAAAAVVLAVAVGVLVLRSDVLSERAQNVFDTKDHRIDYWQAAIRQWKLQPGIGTGSGTYLYFGRQFRNDHVQVDPVYVHNDYLQLLAEYGIIGFVLSVVFLVAHLRHGWKSFERLRTDRPAMSQRLLSNTMSLQIGALSAVVAYVIHSFFDFNLHIPANVLMMAFVFAVLASPGPQAALTPKRSLWPAIAWPFVPVTIAIIITVQCFRLLPGEYYSERARVALRDYDPPASIFFALRGLQSEQKNPDLYQYLGSAQLDLADTVKDDPKARASLYEAAIESFEKGRALAPRDKNFWVAIGMACDQLGRFPEGEWMLEEAQALDPKFRPLQQLYREHLRRWQAGRTGL